MQRLCDRYPASRTYVDDANSLGRGLYGFDANYVAELAEVLRREASRAHAVRVCTRRTRFTGCAMTRNR
jgi:hypothetical protein